LRGVDTQQLAIEARAEEVRQVGRHVGGPDVGLAVRGSRARVGVAIVAGMLPAVRAARVPPAEPLGSY
jgi:hypothetical protein